jgi:hypothetical protein
LSIEATNHVFKHTPYPPAQSYILLAIADVVNDTHAHRFFLGIPKLAQKTKCSERTVQRALSQFVEDGWLSIESDGGGRGNTTEYRFNFLKGDNLSEAERVTNEALKGDNGGIKRVTNEVSIHLLELNRTKGTQWAAKFEEFWDTYPIHNGGRANSEKAWAKAVKQASPETIIEGARKYRDDPNRQKEFTAYPATWLNQGRWADDPLPPQALKTGMRAPLAPAAYNPVTLPPKHRQIAFNGVSECFACGKSWPCGEA